jgi:hypothetical protein
VTDHPNLTAALAAVQAQLPVIAKDKTAKVSMKTGGSYTYQYVDLATISAAVLPLLGAAGLAWTTQPTLNDEGRFTLRYQLRHTSGEEVAGAYPLPGNGTPQEIGSAITYGRRYCLCSVVGVAPDEDDDGQAASKARNRPHPEPQSDDPWAYADARLDQQAEAYAVLADQAVDVDGLRALWVEANGKGLTKVALDKPVRGGVTLHDHIGAVHTRLEQDAAAEPGKGTTP